MHPDDPRHGTIAGEQAHRWGGGKPCAPCAEARAAYERRVREIQGARPKNLVDATGTQRRIQALMTLGWSGTWIAAASGISQAQLWATFRRAHVYGSTAERVAKAYDQMCMSFPPSGTRGERVGRSKARALARRRGWAPPLAWNDIDDPDEIPTHDAHQPRRLNDITISSEYDEAVVLRILAGDPVPATHAERVEVVRRWPGSLKELERLTGWKSDRYAA